MDYLVILAFLVPKVAKVRLEECAPYVLQGPRDQKEHRVKMELMDHQGTEVNLEAVVNLVNVEMMAKQVCPVQLVQQVRLEDQVYRV